MVRKQNIRLRLEMAHSQGHFPGGGYVSGMTMKVTAVDKIKEPEDGTMHTITRTTWNRVTTGIMVNQQLSNSNVPQNHLKAC